MWLLPNKRGCFSRMGVLLWLKHTPSWGYLCKSLHVLGDLTTDVYLIRGVADKNGNLLLCGTGAKKQTPIQAMISLPYKRI